MIFRIFGMMVLLAAQLTWAQEIIRLKHRLIQTGRVGARGSLTAEPRPKGADDPLPEQAAPFGRRSESSDGRHLILQFGSFPGPAVRQELARRRILVLGYVPDFGLMVASDGPPDLHGLGVIWSGHLQAADKLSPALETVSASADVVVFEPDVDMAAARVWVQSLGLAIIENPYLLPSQLLVTGGADGLQVLADSDAVAYIYPASPDLVAGNPVMGCAGPITEAGPIAEYVAAGPGWPADSSGQVALQYFFQSLTEKIDQATAEAEIERAFREWEKYANVTLSQGAKANAVRTIAILFARGDHGDGYPFDGPGGVLAHTFYPAPLNSEPIAGDMHFDADEDWHVGAATDLFSVALHEAGHALGLAHSSNPGAVMYPYYRFTSGLTSDDIAGIQTLYGSASAGSPPPATPAVPPATPPSQPPVRPPSQPPVQPPSQPPVVDTTPPSLNVVTPAATIVSTTSASLHFAGTASDDTGVAGVKWSTSNGDAGEASGTVSWAADVPLLIGSTVVTIRAYDAAGNSGWRSVTVVRH